MLFQQMTHFLAMSGAVDDFSGCRGISVLSKVFRERGGWHSL